MPIDSLHRFGCVDWRGMKVCIVSGNPDNPDQNRGKEMSQTKAVGQRRAHSYKLIRVLVEDFTRL